MPARTPFCALTRRIALPTVLAWALVCPAARAQTPWRAAPQAATQLSSAPVTASGWRLLVPAWARPQAQITDQGRTSLTTTQTWAGRPRPNGTFPVLIVLTTEMQSALSLPTPDGVLDAIEARTLAGKANLVVAPREHSTLHGLPAVREYWKYTVPGSGQMHGFLYAAAQGLHFVVLTGMDAAPGHMQTLPTLEAAALSLQSTRPPEAAVPLAPPAPPLPAPAHPADALGEEATVFGYKIRPPLGYVPHAKVSAQLQMTFWLGPRHADGQVPMLGVGRSIVPVAAGMDAKTANAGVLVGLLHSLQGQYQNVQTNPARAGVINSLPALYVYWTGTAPATGAHVHGFAYGAQDGGTLLVFLGQDSEPTQSATLPVLDASVMTFHH